MTVEVTNNKYPLLSEDPTGGWVQFEDVKNLIIKLTQGTEWNSTSLNPIEREECLIMLVDGEIKPALMLDGVWTKLTGYMYDFDFNKSDVIKWRYNQEYPAKTPKY